MRIKWEMKINVKKLLKINCIIDSHKYESMNYNRCGKLHIIAWFSDGLQLDIYWLCNLETDKESRRELM